MSSEEIPWGPVGYVTYKRTYSRRLEDNNANSVTEEYLDSIKRGIQACREQLKVGFSEAEETRLQNYLISLKGSWAGRFWWQLGTETVNKLGLLSLQNCAFTVIDSPIRPFTWAMDCLMLGCGVGFNIQKEYIYNFPKIKRAIIKRKDTKDADFIVPDSREGWVELLKRVLEAHFISGNGFSYSTICIRGKGTPINSFGGLASGPEELCWGISEISTLLNTRASKKARPIDCLDIMNIIGAVVVAGNVRRSAELSLGDMDDLQYLSAKRWDEGSIPNWRAMSNNTVVCNDIKLLPEQFWNGYSGNGEPYGLFNLKLAKSIGRLEEAQYPDPKIAGANPCLEQVLAPYETCCLAEIFLPNISSIEEFQDIAKMLYRICKHSLLLKCHHPETQKIVRKQMRMGIGITGYLQATKEQKQWLAPTYKILREFDVEYSKQLGVPTSVKLTTVKPSGTLSLLAGVTPGCHPAFAKFYIRRIRMSSNIPLVELCRENGYPIEFQKNFDGTEDRNTVVVSFPCSHPKGTITAKEMTAIDQLEIVKELQTNWSDNAVSCTIYYTLEELPEIKAWLKEHYNNSVKAVSFLLKKNHGFVQAPMEEITEEEYNAFKSKVKPIDKIDSIVDNSIMDNLECEGGVCPVK